MANKSKRHNSGFDAMEEQPLIIKGSDISNMTRVQVSNKTAFFVPKGTNIAIVKEKWERAHLNSDY